MDARIHSHHRWFVTACALCCATLVCATVGCKGNGNSELLERELRLQENRIYELEDELESKCDALEAARRENQLIKRGDTGGAGSSTNSGGRSSSPLSSKRLTPPSISGPGPADTAPPAISVPSIDIPGDAAPTLPAPSGTAPVDPDEPPPLFIPGAEPPGEASRPAGEANNVAKLVLNRQLTGGWNSDGKFGDEGLFVAFALQDAKKQPVKAIGDISIVALDPTQSGPAGRVGRWDFTSDEAAAHFHEGPLGSGVQFELPWPSEAPVSRDLKIFVRMNKPDGGKVETDAAVKIIPMDREGKKWTPRAMASDEKSESRPQLQERPVRAAVRMIPLATPSQAARLEPIPMPENQKKTVRRPRWSPNR